MPNPFKSFWEFFLFEWKKSLKENIWQLVFSTSIIKSKQFIKAKLTQGCFLLVVLILIIDPKTLRKITFKLWIHIYKKKILKNISTDLARWWAWWHQWNHRFGPSDLWLPRGSWPCFFVAQFGPESAPSALHTWTHTNKEVSAQTHKNTVEGTQGLMNVIRGSRRGSMALLTFTDPACTDLRDDKTTQEQMSKERYRDEGTRSSARRKLNNRHKSRSGKKRPAYLKQPSVFLTLFVAEPQNQRSNKLRLQSLNKI